MPPFAAAHGLTAFSLEQNRPIAANSLITKRNQCFEYTLAINIVKAIVETLCTAPKLCCVLERALARRNSQVRRNSEHALMRMTDSSFRASGKIPRASCVGECVIPSTGCILIRIKSGNERLHSTNLFIHGTCGVLNHRLAASPLQARYATLENNLSTLRLIFFAARIHLTTNRRGTRRLIFSRGFHPRRYRR